MKATSKAAQVLLIEWFITATASAQFTLQQSGTKAGLRGIASVDGRVAWASGTNGTVLRTLDGGEHWGKCAIPDGAAELDFRGVQAWDADTAVVMSSGRGDLSRLYKTTDGSKTWTLMFTNPDKDGFWDAVSAPGGDPTTGTLFSVLGDPVDGKFVFLTSDRSGGPVSFGPLFWRSDNKGDLSSTKNEEVFAASNSAYFVEIRDGPELFGTGGADGARIHLSCDVSLFQKLIAPACKGREMDEWVAISMPMFPKSTSGGIFSIEFRTLLRGVAVGGDYKKPNQSIGTAAYTLNNNVTWHAAIEPPHGFRSSVAWDDINKVWITVGPNGTDISRDDGRTWKAVNPKAGEAAGADKNWNALGLPFVVGPDGRIGKLVTEDIR